MSPTGPDPAAGAGWPPAAPSTGPDAQGERVVAAGVADPGAPTGLVVVWLRVAQFAVDLAIVAAAALGASMLMQLIPKAPDGTYGNPVTAMLMFVAILAAVTAINLWYWIVRPLRHAGQTLAMSWFGLQVVPLAGTRVTATQLTLRMVLLAADGMFMGLVGLLAMLSNPRRQRLGDAVANTFVVRTTAAWGRRGQPGVPARGRRDQPASAVAQPTPLAPLPGQAPTPATPAPGTALAEPMTDHLGGRDADGSRPELTPAPGLGAG